MDTDVYHVHIYLKISDGIWISILCSVYREPQEKMWLGGDIIGCNTCSLGINFVILDLKSNDMGLVYPFPSL